MSDDTPAVVNASGKVPLYTQLRGDAITIGAYGQAQNTVACWVPESVAVEMAQDPDMRKRLGPAPLAPFAADTEAPKGKTVVQDEDKPPRRRRRK